MEIVQKLNIVALRGNSFSTRFEFWQGTSGTTPLSIVGTYFTMDVYKKLGTGNPVLSFSAKKGIEVLNSNSIRVFASGADMNFSGEFEYVLNQHFKTGDIVAKATGVFVIGANLPSLNAGDTKTSTIKAIYENVVAQGYSKTQLDSKLARIEALAMGLPVPDPLPEDTIYINNVPLKINGKVITASQITNQE